MPAATITRPPYNVVQPGAYSAVNVSELTSAPTSTGPIPAFIGTAKGGLPTEALFFSAPGQLLAALRSGPVYDLARFALGANAPTVCVVRVGNSISQGKQELSGTTAGILVTLTSRDFGTWVNAITVTVEAGPVVRLAYVDELGNTFKESWDLTSLKSGEPTNEEIAKAINGQLYGYTASNFVTAVAGAGTGKLKTQSATALTGGTDGSTPAAGDWTNGLTALETQDVSIVVPATAEESVHAQVAEHCNIMSLANARKERTCLVGGLKGETVTKQKERIAALPFARTQLVYPGLFQYNAQGALTLYDPLYRAGMVAGMHCALPDVATSLTHKLTPEIAPEINLSTVQGGPIDQLLLAGVTPFAPAPGGGVWCVDSITGAREAAGVFRDFHKVRSADFVSRYLRVNLERKFTGSKALNGSMESIELQAAVLLKELQARQIIRAFKEPTVEAGPTTGAVVTSTNSYNLTAPVMLVDTNKFIFISVALQSPTTIPAG